MSTLNIEVPTGLANIGAMVQDVVGKLVDGQPTLTVLSGALPVVFAEASNLDALKTEIKDPQALALAGYLIGQIAAKWVADRKVKAQAQPAVAAPASPPVAAPAPVDQPAS